MWVPLRLRDASAIAHWVGILLGGVGLAMVLPLLTAVFLGEWDPAMDYLLGIGVTASIGMLLALLPTRGAQLTHSHSLVIAGVAWLAASALAATPLAFSGNYLSYLDAFFDAVSGFTTSGLTLVVDLDHMSYAHNMWRHLTHLIGGQGIIVAAVSLAMGLRGGALSLYLAEARDERILPNVVNTARFIWFVTAVWVLAGTLGLTAVNLWLRMAPLRAVLHGFWMAIAAYDTGGFAPQSMNAGYYHAALFELVLVFVMMAGGINFSLHAYVWRGNFSELAKNVETRTLAANALILTAFAAIGLAGSAVLNLPMEVIRKGAFHVISAHTGTGHQTIFPSQWSTDFAGAAIVAVILAMGAGAAIFSTAGGIKAMRIALILRTVLLQIKRSLGPPSAAMRLRYHHLATRLLTPEQSAAAMSVFTLYMVTYITGGLVGAAYGYPAHEALFESVSAAANVGLSTGITSPAMPAALKVVYILQMWAGRLEFVAVFVLVADIVMALVPDGVRHRLRGLG